MKTSSFSVAIWSLHEFTYGTLLMFFGKPVMAFAGEIATKYGISAPESCTEQCPMLGFVTFIVGMFYLMAGLEENTRFAYYTVVTRYFAPFGMLALWYIGKIPTVAVIATSIDLLSATWTLMLLRSEATSGGKIEKTKKKQ